ncbi:MAG: NAD-dependent epimerase/dehydratase family protein [Anaerolineales bacterium]
MQRVLITGSSGFLGHYLKRQLDELEFQVFGYDKRETSDKNQFTGDITDRNAIKNALQRSEPEVIFHLAGLIKSDQVETFYAANVLGTVGLFESLLETGQRPIVIVPSSSSVYGSGRGTKPITERSPLRPMTHYAVSKLAQEAAALRYWNAFQLPVIVTRPFNLLGPGQPPDLACSAFARQIALAEVRGTEEIVTGALTNRRDFVDVRDVVRAFVLAAEMGKPGQVYNVCSGRAVLMKKCLDELLSMSPHPLKVRLDAQRVQKNDVAIQVGSAQKLQKTTGWRPKISLKQSLSDLLEYWRQRVQSEVE